MRRQRRARSNASGTRASESLDFVRDMCATFGGEKIAVGIDARHGKVAVKGWTETTEQDATALALAVTTEPLSFAAIEGALFEILYAGIFSSGLAFILQVVGQRYTTAPQAAIFLSSEALFAALFGVLLLGEVITPIGYAGCAIIFVSMLAVEIVPELMKDRRAGRPVEV